MNVTVSIDHERPMTDDDLMIDPVSDTRSLSREPLAHTRMSVEDVRVGGTSPSSPPTLQHRPTRKAPDMAEEQEEQEEQKTGG